jgi:hypothetical protein
MKLSVFARMRDDRADELPLWGARDLSHRSTNQLPVSNSVVRRWLALSQMLFTCKP